MRAFDRRLKRNKAKAFAPPKYRIGTTIYKETFNHQTKESKAGVKYPDFQRFYKTFTLKAA